MTDHGENRLGGSEWKLNMRRWPSIAVATGMNGAGRSRRVTVLLIGIAALSFADLVLTAVHLRATGMEEANPIAAFIINSSGSLLALSLYKMGTVGLSLGLIYRLRRHVQGELAAWIAAAILIVLAFHWHSYAAQIDPVQQARLAHVRQIDGGWLWLD